MSVRAQTPQPLPLKRPALTPVAVACPVFPTPPPPVRQQVDEANRLATLGQESSLEGDHRAARDRFNQAATLNPREASLAYRLGREYEALGQREDAVRQYCRYLSLAPNASDAAQVSAQVSHLLAPDAVARGNDVVVAFRGGVTDFDARDYDGAVTAFTKAAQDSALTDAIYNRALAHDRNGEAAAAIRDYTAYLRLDPQASDAAAVRGRIDALRSGIPSPGTAFALGLLPGGGQFYTRQPVLGVAVIAGVGAGVALALHTTTVTRDTTYTAPFGGTYPGTYTQTEHPNLALGAGVAGGVLLFGAIEAALVAHSRGADFTEASADATRAALLPHVGPVVVQLPTLLRSSQGLSWQFPLRIAVR
jgi:tetratricopeptide (TPR) repeat protein